MTPMADSGETTLESLSVDPTLLESANRWFDISWYGLLIAGGFTAVAAFATVFFLFIQFWSSGVREHQTELRTATLELETGKAKAELAKANADIASANAEIAGANKQIASLEKDAAEARRDLAAANARAAEANQKAEAEQKDAAEARRDLAAANARAAEANQKAEAEQKDGEARRDLAAANARAAEANQKAEAEQKDAAEARRDLAAANARAAEADQKAEAERLERLKSELQTGPQDLAGQSRNELVALFRSFGVQSVDVFAYAEGSRPDMHSFAQTMIAVFTEAGWRARYWTTIGGAGVVTGVVVATRQGSDEYIESAANSIVLGLRHWDFAASRWDQHFTTNDAKEIPGAAGVSGPTWDANDVAPIRVFVGTKPP